MVNYWLALSLLLAFAAITFSAEFEDDFNIPEGWRMQVYLEASCSGSPPAAVVESCDAIPR